MTLSFISESSSSLTKSGVLSYAGFSAPLKVIHSAPFCKPALFKTSISLTPFHLAHPVAPLPHWIPPGIGSNALRELPPHCTTAVTSTGLKLFFKSFTVKLSSFFTSPPTFILKLSSK